MGAGIMMTRLRYLSVVLASTVCWASAAMANDAGIANDAALGSDATEYNIGSDMTIQQAFSYMRYSGGDDRVQFEIAPNYSEDLGFSLKGAVGAYLTDELALGLIVEYGENKREYLANVGIQFSDAISLIGTVGMLEENTEYVDGEGRERVQQMEYGVSLNSAHEFGILTGLELAAYLADASVDSDSVEAGKIYGVQMSGDLALTETTYLTLSGGYEVLEWDSGEDDSSFTFSAAATQYLTDALSLNAGAKLGVSEYVYSGGLAYDLSDGGPNTNTLAVNYTYIDGQDGIKDDQRVELSWSIGFGAGTSMRSAAADALSRPVVADRSITSRVVHPTADVPTSTPANNLLPDVMKRPGYLPERTVSRAVSGGKKCLDANYQISGISYDSVNEGWVVALTAPVANSSEHAWSLSQDASNGFTGGTLTNGEYTEAGSTASVFFADNIIGQFNGSADFTLTDQLNDCTTTKTVTGSGGGVCVPGPQFNVSSGNYLNDAFYDDSIDSYVVPFGFVENGPPNGWTFTITTYDGTFANRTETFSFTSPDGTFVESNGSASLIVPGPPPPSTWDGVSYFVEVCGANGTGSSFFPP